MEFKNLTGEDKVVTLSQPGLPADHKNVKAGEAIELSEEVGKAYGFTSSEAVEAEISETPVEVQAEEGIIHTTPVETKQKKGKR